MVLHEKSRFDKKCTNFVNNNRNSLCVKAQLQATTAGSSLDIKMPLIELQENQEDTIDFYYFHADIIKDSLGGEVRITATAEATIITLKPVSTHVEILWHQLKEAFVNKIFFNSKQNKGIRIRSFILESYYNWVNKARGVLTKTSLSYKVRWFLSELLVVAPNSSIRKMSQLLEPNVQKLLRQYLLTNMDTMVLNLKTVATKLKNMKSVRPEMDQLVKISESGLALIENYSFLRHIISDLFKEEDEIINQHIALLDYIHTEVHDTYQDILIDGVQRLWRNRDLEKSGEDGSSYYDVLIADLQKNLKNLHKKEYFMGITKINDLTVAEFISDSNGGKVEVDGKIAGISKKESNVEKIEDFEYFILSEIEKAVKHPQQNIWPKHEDKSDALKSADDKTDKDVKSEESVLHSSQNQSEGDDRKSKVLTKENEMDVLLDETVSMEETVDDKRRKKSTAGSMSDLDEPQESESASVITDISDARTEDSSNEKHSPKRENIGDTQRNTRKTDSRTESFENSVESNVTSTDPVKELEKSINVKEDLAVLQKNSRISDTRSGATESDIVEKEKKHSSKDDKFTRKPHLAKHINDEL